MALAEVLTEKGLPAHLLAERSVLGAVLLDGLAFSYAAELLHAADFHLDTHRRIFKAMAALAESNRAIDIVTLGDQLERDGQLEAVGGQEFLYALTDGLPRSINSEHYARIVKDRSILRQLLSAAQSISAQCLSGADSAAALDEAQRQIFAIADERVQEGLSSVGDIAPELLRRLDKMHGQEITGLRTGYRDFDQITADHRRSASRGSDHHRRPPLHGQNRAGHEHRGKRGPGREQNRGSLQPGNVESAARAAHALLDRPSQ